MISCLRLRMDAPRSLPTPGVPVVGEILAGKYRVERVLGAGGMGVVLAATHLQLQQRVALKLMLPEALARPVLAERFAREARAAARLKSVHVAHVFDVGQLDSGLPYMVMEYLEGSDLASMLEQQGRLEVDAAIDCLLQACDAVAEAHAMGIVHRNLKPGNLFVTVRNDGHRLLKVLDFGISKQASDLSLDEHDGDSSARRTTCPPSSSGRPGSRTRGATSGRSASSCRSSSRGAAPSSARRSRSSRRRSSRILPQPLWIPNDGATAALARVVSRCLQKEPARRFQSVAELAAALAPLAHGEARGLAERVARIAQGGTAVITGSTVDQPTSVAVARTSRSTSGRRWGLVAGIGVLGAAGLTFVSARHRILSSPGDAETHALPAAMTAAEPPAPASAPSLLPAPSPEPVVTAPAPTATASSTASFVDAGVAHPPRPQLHPRPAPLEAPEPPPTPATGEPPSHRTSW